MGTMTMMIYEQNEVNTSLPVVLSNVIQTCSSYNNIDKAT